MSLLVCNFLLFVLFLHFILCIVVDINIAIGSPLIAKTAVCFLFMLGSSPGDKGREEPTQTSTRTPNLTLGARFQRRRVFAAEATLRAVVADELLVTPDL